MPFLLVGYLVWAIGAVEITSPESYKVSPLKSTTDGFKSLVIVSVMSRLTKSV